MERSPSHRLSLSHHFITHFGIMNFPNDFNPDTSKELSLEEMSEINAGLGPLFLLAPFIVAAKVGAAKAAIGVVGGLIGWSVGEKVYKHASGEEG